MSIIVFLKISSSFYYLLVEIDYDLYLRTILLKVLFFVESVSKSEKTWFSLPIWDYFHYSKYLIYCQMNNQASILILKNLWIISLIFYLAKISWANFFNFEFFPISVSSNSFASSVLSLFIRYKDFLKTIKSVWSLDISKLSIILKYSKIFF